MYIPIDDLYKSIKHTIFEQDLASFSDTKKSEDYKLLLLYIEYTNRYYKLIKNHIENEPMTISPIDLYKSVVVFVKKIISSTEYINLYTSVAQLNIKQHSKLLDMLENSLNLLKKIVGTYKDTDSEEDQLKVFDDLYKDYELFTKSLEKSLIYIRNKYTKDSSSSISTEEPPSLDFINNINDLEKIAYTYLTEIEIIFKKLDNIRIESGEYAKKWEDFNLLRGHTFYMNGIEGKVDGISDDQKKDISSYFRKHFTPNNDVLQASSYTFNVEAFINILYNINNYNASKDYVIKTSKGNVSIKRELDKANSLQKSLNTLFGWTPSNNGKSGSISKTSIEGMLKTKLTDIHNKFWNVQTGNYAYNEELKQIFSILYNVKILYKKMLNKIITNMSNSKNKSLSEIFKINGPIIDAILKYIQFSKLNIRAIYVKLVTNSGLKIDVAKYQEMLTSHNEEVVSKRLAYWALFQKLGWTKGLDNEEAPDWLYKYTT